MIPVFSNLLSSLLAAFCKWIGISYCVFQFVGIVLLRSPSAVTFAGGSFARSCCVSSIEKTSENSFMIECFDPSSDVFVFLHLSFGLLGSGKLCGRIDHLIND